MISWVFLTNSSCGWKTLKLWLCPFLRFSFLLIENQVKLLTILTQSGFFWLAAIGFSFSKFEESLLYARQYPCCWRYRGHRSCPEELAGWWEDRHNDLSSTLLGYGGVELEEGCMGYSTSYHWVGHLIQQRERCQGKCHQKVLVEPGSEAWWGIHQAKSAFVVEGTTQAKVQKYARGLPMSSLCTNLVKDQIILPLCIFCLPYKQSMLWVGYQERSNLYGWCEGLRGWVGKG